MLRRTIRELTVSIAAGAAGALILGAGLPAFAQGTSPQPPAPAAVTTPAPAAPKAAPYTGPTMPLLVFPFDSADVEQGSHVLGPAVAKVVKDATLRSTEYNGLSFSERHPAIKRANSDGVLKDSDLQQSYGLDSEDIEKAMKIAQVMGVPRFVVGTIEDLQLDRAKREATVSVSARIVDTASGSTINNYTASGTTPAAMTTGTDQQIAAAAVDVAAEKLASQIVPPPSSSPPDVTLGQGEPLGPQSTQPGPKPVAETGKKKSNGGALAAIALVIGLIIAASGGGGGGGGSSNGGGSVDNPPPPPF